MNFIENPDYSILTSPISIPHLEVLYDETMGEYYHDHDECVIKGSLKHYGGGPMFCSVCNEKFPSRAELDELIKRIKVQHDLSKFKHTPPVRIKVKPKKYYHTVTFSELAGPVPRIVREIVNTTKKQQDQIMQNMFTDGIKDKK